jgi:outer membrane receptor protein involved in Fe transport
MSTAKPAAATFTLTPLSRAIRQHAAASASALLVVAGALAPQQASADDGLVIEEVVVTAQKRSQSVQDVPISIDVLAAADLENLGVTDLEDFVQMMPSANYTSTGPGSGDIYIRGISSGGENALGSTPNVAVYLDEQPVTAVNSYLNPHIYDIARIESLAGPQGTLFGANSQSGSIRIITNKPDPSKFEASYDVEGNSIRKGDEGYLLEGMVNIPLTDRAALRIVGFHKEDAGFIDNVAGSYTFRNGNVRAGLTDPALIAEAADITVTNEDVVAEDFNEATTRGLRAALGIDLNDDWTLTATVMRQELDSKGVWDHDPTEVGDLQVMRLLPDSNEDEWTQAALVVEGAIQGMTLTYAGSYLERDVEGRADYSLYSDFYVSGGFVQAFYSCYVAYFGQCTDPREQFENHESYQRNNHELRLVSAQDQRFRWLVGAFYEESQHQFDWEWHVLGLNDLPIAAVEPPDIYWTTDQVRDSEETAFFGELSYDLTEDLTASLSARRFDYEISLVGFSGTIFFPNRFGPRVEDANTDLTTTDKDTVMKANLSYNLNEDVMVYGTYSEGYRPGGLNRVFNTLIGGVYEPDFVESFEVGIKATSMDGRLAYNLAAYTMDWDDFQLSRFDVEVSPLTLTDNVGTARSRGIEGDVTYLLSENWDVSLAFSTIQAEITEDYWINRSNVGDGNPDAEKGRELPRVPELKYNVSSRYSFQAADWDGYAQGTFIYTGESYNTLFDGSNEIRTRKLQNDYSILNVAVGFEKDGRTAELFVRNVTDERGEVFKNGASWDSRITTNRPRTVGFRLRQKF